MIDNIRQKLAQTLPGRTAQLAMAPALRQHYKGASDDATVACVLVLLFPKNDQWHFTLIQRMPHEKDRHSGQISFPGGRLEEDDESLLAGALREAEEEVGVPRDEINVLGRLTELYIPVSNFLVHPFVGFLEKPPEFVPQPSEVDNILEIPVAELNKNENKKIRDIKGGKNIILKNVPCFDFEGAIVWGATAMMLSEFEQVVFG
ncbi:MAG: CoA pyrophosphatase [Saprospiraceae bacterium]